MKQVTIQDEEILVANVEGTHYTTGSKLTHASGDPKSRLLK